ncbi:MAG: hypothetical protein ABWU16_01320 [Halothiobacillaceae bacterium]
MDEPRFIRLLNSAHRTLAERRIPFSMVLLTAGASFLWPLFRDDPSLIVSGYPAMGLFTLLLGLMLATLPVPHFIALFFLHERLNPRPAHPAESLWAIKVAQESVHLEGLVRPWKVSRTAMPRHVVIRVWARWKLDAEAR